MIINGLYQKGGHAYKSCTNKMLGVSMDTCKRFRKMISDYIEGSLSRADRLEFEKHIELCKDCFDTVEGEKGLLEEIHHFDEVVTSEDFDTVLRTRIRIESGIGRRRLGELFWTWPARIPVYGMSLALILIASVMVLNQINGQKSSTIPQPYINNEWYGGNPSQNNFDQPFTETENVIYMIDRLNPEQLIDNSFTDSNTNDVNLVDTVYNDSLKVQQTNSMQTNNTIVY